MSELDAAKAKADAELKELRDSQQQRKLEMDREQRRKERHEKDLKELKRMLDEQTMELKSKQGQLAQAEDNIARLEQRVKDQHAFIQKQVKDFEKLNHEHHRTKGQLEDAQTESNRIQAELQLKDQNVKTKEHE